MDYFLIQHDGKITFNEHAMSMHLLKHQTVDFAHGITVDMW